MEMEGDFSEGRKLIERVVNPKFSQSVLDNSV